MCSRNHPVPSFVLIIGAAKCGTTSLFEYLSQHPAIARCTYNEPCFFSRDKLLKKGIDWYDALWNWDPSQHRHAVEASTNYTKIPNFPNVAQRISNVDRSFKFIYIIRHPVDRIESYVTHGIAAGWKDPPKTPSDLDHAINVSRYAMQLEEYEQRFHPDDLLLLDFEKLNDAPRQLLRNTYRFLDVDPEVPIDSLHAYNTAADRTKDHPLVKQLRKIQPLADAVKHHTPRSLVNKARNWLGQPMEEEFTLTQTQRKYVIDQLTDDLTKLESKFGFPVQKWEL